MTKASVCFCITLILLIIFATKTIVLQYFQVLQTARVVIDVDAGIDDYQALTFLLNADNNNLIKIEAILCVRGNTALPHVQRNVIRFLETAGRLDIPIYKGARRPMRPTEEPLETWFGEDGFGDLEDLKKEPDLNWIQEKDALNALYDIVRNNPGEISLIALAPLTNVAMTSMLYEDFLPKLRDIHIMGGNYGEDAVEFNFLGDPDAAKLVFDSINVPAYLLTWQACRTANNTLDWRFGIELSKPNPIWILNEKAERSQFKNASLDQSYNTCDGATAMSFLDPKLVLKQKEICATVEVEGAQRGAVVVRNDCERNNINVIEVIDEDLYRSTYIKGFEKACDSGLCKDVY